MASFAGEYRALAAMMRESWGQNNQQPLDFSEEFLRSAFDYPGATFDLAPSVYRDGELVAFGASFPRTAQLGGRDVRLLLNTFLTVAADCKRLGYGPMIWGEFVKRARANDFDGMLDYCVEGDDMNRLILGIARLLKLPTTRIATVSYVARLLAPAREPSDDAADVVETFMDAARDVPASVPLRRTWTAAEAEWQCRRRAGAVTVTHTVGSRRGIITGYLIEMLGTPPSRCVLLDDLLWGDLEPDERGQLVERFLATAAFRGAQIAVAPVLGYAELETLKHAGFRKTRRQMHAYLTVFDGAPPAVPLEAMYMDVY